MGQGVLVHGSILPGSYATYLGDAAARHVRLVRDSGNSLSARSLHPVLWNTMHETDPPGHGVDAHGGGGDGPHGDGAGGDADAAMGRGGDANTPPGRGGDEGVEGGLVALGPLRPDLTRRARTLLGAQTGAMALLVALTIVVGIVLLPRVLAGFGMLGPTEATVVSAPAEHSTSPQTGSSRASSTEAGSTQPGSPQTATQSDGSSCLLSPVSLRWSDGGSGSLTWCTHDDEAVPAVGDTVTIWALSGYGPVQASGRSGETVIGVGLLVILFGTAWGGIVFGRRLRAVRHLGQHDITAPRLHGQIDRLAKQRGIFKRDTRMRIRITFGVPGSNFDAPWGRSAYRPLRLNLPYTPDRSLLGAKLEVFPIGQTMRGRATGPYVLRRIRYGTNPSGTLVALGRAYRASHER